MADELTRLVIVTGKGGVGKSAVAAACGLVARRSGAKALAIDMTDAGGLGSHLGEPELGFQPRPIGEGLEAMTIDRADALVEYLRVQIGVPTVATIGPAARTFDALASTAPAVREVITIGKILWEVKKETWDLVVVDAAPTGQIGSYLRAARTIRELVTTGRILDQVDWMEQILADPDRTELKIVTLLEELPASETAETLAWLAAEDIMGLTTVTANRALPELLSDVPAGGGALTETATLHRNLWKEQQRWAAEAPTDEYLPFLFGTHTPTEVAEQLADVMEAR